MFFCTVPSKSCNCAKSQGSPIHQCCVILAVTGGIRGPALPHYARTVNLVFLNICKVLLVLFFEKKINFSFFFIRYFISVQKTNNIFVFLMIL